MKAIIKSYCIYTNTPEGEAEYAALVSTLNKSKFHCAWGGTGTYYFPWAKGGLEIDLETEHLFGNQWNTAPIDGVSDKGYRVFDWAEDYPIDFPKYIKRGHYLVITPDMEEVRRNTHKCGYCGKQEPAQKGYVFCPHCMGSAYLDEKSLHLRRMLPVESDERPPLTESERAYLIPIWKEAQLKGAGERCEKAKKAKRLQIENGYKNAINKAETEYKGFTWLLDNGFNVENVIYYSHTNKFSFGWMKPIDGELLSSLLDIISEFPFNYEIKCGDGRTLTN